MAALLACCAGVVGFAVAGQIPASPGLRFIQVGHWVFDSGSESAVHVDGSTSQVDARARIPGGTPGSRVAQGEDSGYVVERTRITVFSKSTLSVVDTLAPPAPEVPVVLEVAGGPYLVYRNAGQVVRLGDPTASVPAGGPLTDPVTTSDGSVWLHRIDNGALCELTREGTRMACPAHLESGHDGALTVVQDRPVLLDTTSDTLHVLGTDGLGESAAIGLDLPTTAKVAGGTAADRLAVVDPEHNALHLIDSAGLFGHPAAKPIAVDLLKGSTFAGPVTTGNVVAVVDQTRDELLTFDSTGELLQTTPVPGAGGAPNLTKGEDNRIYVDSADGSHVLVVSDDNGAVTKVVVVGDTEPTGTTAPTSNLAAPPPAAVQTPPTSASRQAPSSTGTGPPTPRPAPTTTASPKTTTAPQTRPTTPEPPPVAAATPPGAPGSVTAVAADGSVTVSWNAAAANGAPITAYQLSWPGGRTRVNGSTLSAKVSGLSNGTPYRITVAAENSAGRGPSTTSRPVTPLRPAGAPKVTSTTDADSVATVQWTRPDLGSGTLVHYLVSAPGQADRTVTTLTTRYTDISGTVTVRAVTRSGPAGAPTVPGAPGSTRVYGKADLPVVTITGAEHKGGTGIVLTVNAVTKDLPATCRAGNFFGDGFGDPVPCSGVTELIIPFWGVIGGPVTYRASIENAAGTAETSATIQLGANAAPGGNSGGAVFWIWPIAALAVARIRHLRPAMPGRHLRTAPAHHFLPLPHRPRSWRRHGRNPARRSARTRAFMDTDPRVSDVVPRRAVRG